MLASLLYITQTLAITDVHQCLKRLIALFCLPYNCCVDFRLISRRHAFRGSLLIQDARATRIKVTEAVALVYMITYKRKIKRCTSLAIHSNGQRSNSLGLSCFKRQRK